MIAINRFHCTRVYENNNDDTCDDNNIITKSNLPNPDCAFTLLHVDHTLHVQPQRCTYVSYVDGTLLWLL